MAKAAALSWMRMPSRRGVPGQAPPSGHSVMVIPYVAPLGYAVMNLTT